MRGGIATVIALMSVHAVLAQTPPTQPTTGPGSTQGQTQYTVQQATYGTGGTQYWIYTPQPMPTPAPVVVFVHGFAALQPGPYLDWITHIVKRGNIVIYPKYQESTTENPKDYTPNAISAIKSALGVLGSSADLSRYAYVAHSYGGVIEFNLAAEAAAQGLPVPKAIFAAHPGDSVSPVPTIGEYSLFSQIPASTLVLMLVGDADDLVGDTTAKNIIAALPQVPQKNFLTVQSDNHGSPALSATHIAPNAPPTDALDWFAYWKLSDAIVDLAFYGFNGDFALGGGNNQLSMGSWSDGVPVRPLLMRPTLWNQGLVNAATMQPGPVAPGEMVVLFGAGLGPAQLQPAQVENNGFLSKTLSGTRVLFNGIPSPLIYTLQNQVAAVVPYAVTAGPGTVAVQVQTANYTSASINVSVTPSNPGIFSTNGSGTGQGAILNQNYSANSSRNPALKGSQIIIYSTGAGINPANFLDGAVVSGTSALAPFSVAVNIGGIPASVTYAGSAPGFVSGVLQVNVQLPTSLPSGDLPVVLTVGGIASQNGITVSVK
jgi:uncharacterized protein (TIGR03437 family)